MIILQVTSLSQGAGKTAVCAGLGSLLIKHGKKVGYSKSGVGSPSDADTVFMQHLPGFSGADTDGLDVKLVEIADKDTGRIPNAKTIAVLVYSEIDKIAAFNLGASNRDTCFIINKVPTNQLIAAKQKIPALQTAGFNVIGLLPEDKVLRTLTLGELAQLIDGQIASEAEMKDLSAANFMLGAMTVDSALPYFNRKTEKVAILRAERADMQMAALATDTRALVLYGETPIIPMVALRARDKKVMLITTKLNAAAVTGRLEEGILNIKFNQPGKLPRFVELMSQHIDLPALYKALAII